MIKLFDPGLTRVIWRDLGKHVAVLLLGAAVLGSALWVVETAFQARLLTNELNVQLQHRDELGIEWRHLLLEEQTLSEHSRVSRLAEKQLNMARPAPGQEVVVRLP
ncbi:cell division protein FtsL [Ferrimonas aestuarii]|uniref:Cell division protein FtsL n=1 Tax=Ferrimonas aestuarii TaxID=2569539 RepID=A0A4U1BNW2_9GAMM|nr:cell division protein FtsL [Ferrimonas aestuarii]TKB53734.1 cell division protein FtsL [Ferrimonas aestuarii]